ncbi:MAG: HAMP domain-containing sensor histidine kinase [Lachnospiraceae bacterium]|nr:HAMP domain-containing sensor histidine kinase [Lachnospiraceae bacterium]
MERLRKQIRDLPLYRFFILSVLITFCTVAVLSGIVIWGCTAFRHYLLPDSNAIFLTVDQKFSDGSTTSSTMRLEFNGDMKLLPELKSDEGQGGLVLDEKYSVQKIENSFDTLTPKRKLAYRLCGAAMISVPVLLSIGGILICGFYFYRRKLAEPLKILSDAAGQITAQNLDFSITYDCGDEMGQLCGAFEQMRAALVENNRAMWEMLEQRRLMQASIAHDLRNPIAIIKGYTEYLQINLPGGRLMQEKTARIVNNLNLAAGRLENYTESVRMLNQLENVPLKKKEVSSSELIRDVGEDMEVIARNRNITLNLKNKVPEMMLHVDGDVFYRILENVSGNAFRFAESCVCISFQYDRKYQQLQIIVTDDGRGFSEEILRKKKKLFLPSGQEDGHLGMGLAISRLLCEKHGGSLEFYNEDSQDGDSRGAVVELRLAV